jgi:2-methylcitrate dehydratase PrpD
MDARLARTRIAEIAAWAADLEFDDLPESVIARARLQRASVLAAARAGSTSAAVRRLHGATRAWGAEGGAHVVGARLWLEPAAAAYANAAASIAHDWDDYLYMGHTGHSAVWAARSVAATEGISPDQELVAQVAANEVEGRLGAALFIGPHNGQLWSSIHCAGAAIATGKLLELDADRLAHALAISLYQPPYGLWPGFMGPDTKLLTAAEPTAQGIRAGGLAASGLTGPLDVIENPRGLLAHLAFVGQPTMLDGLGRVWLTDTLAYKPRPGCAYLQAPVEGLLQLLHEGRFAAEDVERIDVDCGYLAMAMEALAAGQPLTPVSVNFSIKLSAAVILLAGRLTHEELHEDWLRTHCDQLNELAARVHLHHDWDLTVESVTAAAAGGGHAQLLAMLPLAQLRLVRRRMHELGLDGYALGLGDARTLLARGDVRRAVARNVRDRFLRRARADGAARQTLDTSRLRMTFPVRLRITLHSGRTVEVAAAERGACGAPLAEQSAVVREKWLATRGTVGELELICT